MTDPSPTFFPAICRRCCREWIAGFPDGVDNTARFALECPTCGNPDGRPKFWDGCEWNPEEDRAAYETDAHHQRARAEVLVGADGRYRLCASCAGLERFKRFRRRKRIGGGGADV